MSLNPSHSPFILKALNNNAQRLSAFSMIQSPLRLRANSHSVERSLGFHGSCSSLPREARVQAIPRAKGSPMHTYTSVEITNVWNGHYHPHYSSSSHCLHSYCILTVYYWELSTLHLRCQDWWSWCNEERALIFLTLEIFLLEYGFKGFF